MHNPPPQGHTTDVGMSILDPLLLPPIPWKNGRGLTREVVTSPPGAGHEGFNWRLSIADIVESGPFSSWPGVDRHFLMASEGALVMTIDEETQHLEMGAVTAFAGEAEVDVEVLKGPTRNLNLMTRRSRCRGSITLRKLTGPLLVGGSSGPIAVVILSGTAELADRTPLKPMRVLLGGQREETVLSQNALVAVINVWRA